MKGNECDVMEWIFVELNGINMRNGEEKESKMGEKYSTMTPSSGEG